jgi:hypothetical protein
VQGAADGDEIEASDLAAEVLGPALDQRKRLTLPRGCRARGVEHFGLRIDTADAADVSAKAEREQPGPGSQVNQRVLFRKLEVLCDGGEECGRIGRPQLFI